MFDDDVQLYTSLGISELVKPLQPAMDISSTRHNESPGHKHNESSEKIDKTPGTNNIMVQPVDFNNNMPATQQIYSPNNVQAHQPFIQHAPQLILSQHPMFTGPQTPLAATLKQMQVPNGTGPGIRRSKRPLLANASVAMFYGKLQNLVIKVKNGN